MVTSGRGLKGCAGRLCRRNGADETDWRGLVRAKVPAERQSEGHRDVVGLRVSGHEVELRLGSWLHRWCSLGGRRTELELSCSKVLDDVHACAARRAVPGRVIAVC
jgi:hypothetical protein